MVYKILIKIVASFLYLLAVSTECQYWKFYLSYNIDKLSHWTFILKHQTHSGSSFSNVTICCFSWSQSKIQLANFVFFMFKQKRAI